MGLSGEDKITDLGRRIEELKKKHHRQQSSLTAAEKDKADQTTGIENQPKTPLTLSQKRWLYVSLALTTTSILSILMAPAPTPEQHWSMVFQIVIAAYRTIFYWPIDWMLSLMSVAISSWTKDIVVVIVCSILSMNLLTIRDLGKSYWSVLALEIEGMAQGSLGPIPLSFGRIVLMVYTIIFMIFVPAVLFIAYRKAKRNGEAESWKPTISLAKALLIVILLTLLLTIATLLINAVFDYIGL